MALTLPATDQRTFASLVAEARSRIPRLAPSWTDHNAHDPGITLIELFAYLTELDLYRLGRITAAQRRTFLRWFGLEAPAPSVAETVLQLGGAGQLTQDIEFTDISKTVHFTSLAPVRVQATRLAAPAIHDSDGLLLAFDRPVQGELSLYFWTGAADHDAELVRGLKLEAATACGRLADWTLHDDVDLTWEISTGSGWTSLNRENVRDQTRAFSVSGFVRLNVADGAAWSIRAGAYQLRARVRRGTYQNPPTIARVLLNAVPVVHRSASFTHELERSDGRAGQVLTVPVTSTPLARSDLSVSIDGDAWKIALDWDRIGPDTPAVLVDLEQGELHLGNGRIGRVPRAGAAIVLSARSGGGARGNVEAGTLTRTSQDPGFELLVEQPFAARGGAPTPGLDELQRQLLARLDRTTRAATLADFEQLALAVPGASVARARAVADFHPRFPSLPASGCITLVVLPDSAGPSPQPTLGTLRLVKSYLERRRVLTTELHVVAPLYRQVAVQAQLMLEPSADGGRVVDEARRRLDGFFHPLRGGQDGTGWPIGRDVYRSEILALLQAVPGVHYVTELRLLSGPERAPSCGNLRMCPNELVAPRPHALSALPARMR